LAEREIFFQTNLPK